MIARRLATAAAAAALVVGLGGGAARAGGAVNDPGGAVRDGERIEVAPGSTRLRIRISDLLRNDIGRNIRFIRAFKIPGNIQSGGNNPSSDGIRSIRRNNGFLIIRFKPSFEGDTSFKYEIRTRAGRSRANVFIRVGEAPSPS